MSWADQKDEKLKEPKLKDKKLTFSAVRKFMGNEIPIDYTLTIEGDEFKGKGEADFGAKSRSSISRASARRRASSIARSQVPTGDGRGGPRCRPSSPQRCGGCLATCFLTGSDAGSQAEADEE